MIIVSGQQQNERLYFVCGVQIPIMMDLLCKGKFNTLGKRASVRDASTPSTDLFNEQSEFEQRLTPRHRRDPDDGIVAACCWKPCNRSTMLQYCDQ